MTPAFGFSAGDFIAAAELTAKVIKALKETGGATSEFQNVLKELGSLHAILQHLQTLPVTESNLTYVNAVRALAQDCQKPLEDFLKQIEKYSLLASGQGHKRVVSNLRKAQWAVFQSEEVPKLRAVVAAKIIQIQILLDAFNLESSIRAEDTLNRAHTDLVSKANDHQKTLLEIKNEVLNIKVTVDKQADTSSSLSEELKSAQGYLATITRCQERYFPSLLAATQAGAQKIGAALSWQRSSILRIFDALHETHLTLHELRNVGLQILSAVQNCPLEVKDLLRKILDVNSQIFTLLSTNQLLMGQYPTLAVSDGIHFEDCLGRKETLPFSWFSNWPVFEAMLLVHFENAVGLRQVQQGQYHLTKRGDIILPNDWKSCVLPGDQIQMAVVLMSVRMQYGLCPRPSCDQTWTALPGTTEITCPQCNLTFFSEEPLWTESPNANSNVSAPGSGSNPDIDEAAAPSTVWKPRNRDLNPPVDRLNQRRTVMVSHGPQLWDRGAVEREEYELQKSFKRVCISPSSESGARLGVQSYVDTMVLNIRGDLNRMAKSWTDSEKKSRRRIVQFWRQQKDTLVESRFHHIQERAIPLNSMCISCIWSEDYEEYFVTLVEVLYLVEFFLSMQFTWEEKKTLRGRLSSPDLLTVSWGNRDTRGLYEQIMEYTIIKPVEFHSKFQVLRWTDLPFTFEVLCEPSKPKPLSKALQGFSQKPSETGPVREFNSFATKALCPAIETLDANQIARLFDDARLTMPSAFDSNNKPKWYLLPEETRCSLARITTMLVEKEAVSVLKILLSYNFPLDNICSSRNILPGSAHLFTHCEDLVVHAIHHSTFQTVIVLFDELRRRDPSYTGSDIITEIVKGGNAYMLQQFLENKVSISSMQFPESLLGLAAGFGHTELVAMLLSSYRGALERPPNFTKTVALCRAVGNGYIEAAKLLITAGADPNCQPQSGGGFWSTGLGLAGKNNSPEMIQLMLNAGGDCNVALRPAVESGNLTFVEMLLRRGAKVTLRVKRMRGEIVNLLCDHGDRRLEFAYRPGRPKIAEDWNKMEELLLAYATRIS